MTTTTTTELPPRATLLQVLKMHLTGDDSTVIALATGLTPPEVAEIAAAHGWPDKQQVRTHVRRLENATPAPRPRPPAPARVPEHEPVDDSVERLLEDTKATGVEQLRTRAARVEREIASLREAHEAYLKVRAKHAEVTRLERELAKARAAAGIADQEADQIVRRWAKRQGHDVAPRGRLPQKVRDAYAEANAGGAK